ncbi:MAG: RNA polymerase sigma factor [Gemmatimonadota bacterium]
MTRVARRDEAAFTLLVERFGGRLLSVARRLLRSPEDAEDAVQRTFVQVYTAGAAYRPEWAVSTWLYRILTNICIDELRRRRARARKLPATLRAAGAPSPNRGPTAAPDLDRVLAKLPREARVLVVLRYVDGLSYRELARVRGISVNTVKSQLRRAKGVLRSGLARGGRR